MSFQPLELSDVENFGDAEIPETKNFGQFVTIDWVQEAELQRPAKTEEEDSVPSWRRYTNMFWQRSRELIVLTCIALLLGFIAGSIQIITETLVNWKSGHCARNWLLNKSFCCEGYVDPSNKLFEKRSELRCIEDGVWLDRSSPALDFFLFVTLSVAFAAISALMIKYIAPSATGSGISEIKVWVSGFKYKDEFLNLTTLLVKSTALPLAISSGLSVGKEGPSVHYATCCGFVVTNWLFKHNLKFPEQAEYLIASTAGGVAVAFGAPIGGVLFAIEEISTSSSFKLSILWKSYYVALAAVTTLQYMNPFRNGTIVLFEVTYDNQWQFAEIPIFILLGVFGGAYGLLISAWNVRYVNFRKTYLLDWRVQEVVILAGITALVSYFNEFLKLDMTESMGVLFHECAAGDSNSIWTHRICQLDSNTKTGSFVQIFFALVVATIVRSLLIIMSYGSSVPAGIFVPSMAVGASFGRAISLLVERWVTGPEVITPGTYAFLGAAATLSGITNLTLTVVVIMIELTGAFSYVIPSMIVVAVTHLIYKTASSKGGIADQMIIYNGFPLMENSKEDIDCLEGFTAENIMTANTVNIPATLELSELERILSNNDNLKQLLVVGTEKNDCLGVISSSLLTAEMLQDNDFQSIGTRFVSFIDCEKESQQPDDAVISLGHIVMRSPITISSDMPLSVLHRIFYKLGCKLVVVETRGSLRGLITRKDFLKFQRLKHKQLHGPLYSFNLAGERKYWSILKAIFRIPDNF